MKYTLDNLNRLQDGGETHDLGLSPSELRVTPNIGTVEKAEVTVSATPIGPRSYRLELTVGLEATIIDDHDFVLKPFAKTQSDEVIVSGDPEIESDVPVTADGSFDLRPVALALYYDLVPHAFSTTDLTKVEVEGATLVSEDEYRKEKSNPFKVLDTDDYSDR